MISKSSFHLAALDFLISLKLASGQLDPMTGGSERSLPSSFSVMKDVQCSLQKTSSWG